VRWPKYDCLNVVVSPEERLHSSVDGNDRACLGEALACHERCIFIDKVAVARRWAVNIARRQQDKLLNVVFTDVAQQRFRADDVANIEFFTGNSEVVNYTQVNNGIDFSLAENVFRRSTPNIHAVVDDVLWQSGAWPPVEPYHFVMSI
jgi:hypothetical protein